MIRWLETDSLSNQNIANALAIGAYTADADRLILVQWFADQVAGNGDYIFYLTHQIAGAGSSYRYVPKTTATVDSGVTALAGQSALVTVRSGDVLTVYLDGLAGDTTTPDTIVRWFELAALRPTTADRTLAVDANGGVTLADTQGAITWDQQKIIASADSEGALHLENSDSNGIGLYTAGGSAGFGQQNVGRIGLYNAGSITGNRNEGAIYGAENNAYGIGGRGAYSVALNTGGEGWVAEGATHDVMANIHGSVGSVTNPVTAGTVSDKSGYSLTGTLTTLDAIWAKIQKWFRLALRKDSAVAADHATELAEINANGGGGAGSYANITDSQEAISDRIGTATVTVVSPVSANGTAITVIRGDDYLLTDGRQLAWTSASWPTLTSGTVKLRVKFGKNAAVTEYSATLTGAQACYVALTTTQTAAMVPGVYNFDLQATLSNLSTVTLVQGVLNVREDVR